MSRHADTPGFEGIVEAFLAPGLDGRSPYRLATALDREDVAELLVRYGARDDRTTVDRLLAACLLLARGADIEARDRVFHGSPLAWAAVGSGERPSGAPDPDWEEVVRILLDADASIDGIVLEAGEVGQPSPAVARLLIARSVSRR